MKRVTLLSIVLGSIAILSGCVESSKKYKTLLAKTDSLTAVANAQNAEMESLLAGLNDLLQKRQNRRAKLADGADKAEFRSSHQSLLEMLLPAVFL